MTALTKGNGGLTPMDKPIVTNRAPTSADTIGPDGRPISPARPWVNQSVSPWDIYFYAGAGNWQLGANESASTTEAGSVMLDDDLSDGATADTVPTSVAAKTYIDGIAIAGAPDASTTVKGLVEEGTNTQVVAGTTTGETGARLFVNPGSLNALFASPPVIGGTSAAAGSFTTLGATGLASLSGSATITTGATALNLASDASTGAVNLGTGAGARAIVIGNVTGATAVTVNTGTGHFTVNTTGTGDIILNSDDTMLLDSDGVLELNSSAGAISIGNDDVDQNINLGSDGERVITIGSNNGAAQVDIESGSGGVNIGSAASAQSVTIGNNTGATAIIMEVGTGNFALDGVAASTYSIGSATTTGTITIGGTAQTGALSLGVSTGIMTTNLATGNGAKTLNVATGISGNTLNVASGANTSAQVVNISSGASGADSDVNILSGNGTAGTQTLNILTGNRAGALNLASGSAAHVITIGSASAGAVTVDTAAGISLDAATASNFVVSGATEDLTLGSDGGRVIVTAGEDAADAIYIHADAGTSEKIRIHSDQGTGLDSVELVSDVGGVTVTAGVANAAAFDVNLASGGMTVDAGLGISFDAAGASNFSVSGAANDLDLASTGGRIILTSGEDAADSIYLRANAGTSETIRLHSDQGTGTASVHLESDVGGVTLTSGLASADAVNVIATNGGFDLDAALEVNIASSQAADSAITLSASNAAGGITLTGRNILTPDSITADNGGTAASVSTVVTLITTDGDSNEDNVTLADGSSAGQIKHFAVVAAGNAADSVKITPANMAGGSKITFAADPTGLGCSMVFDGTSWTVFANNGGTIA